MKKTGFSCQTRNIYSISYRRGVCKEKYEQNMIFCYLYKNFL